MLTAYLDASGTDPTKDIIVVGGWVASEDGWAEFVPQWRTFLVDCFGPNGGRWHHTDFRSRHGQYQAWDEQKRNRARTGLCRIIGALKPIGIGAAVRKSDYNELWQTGRWQSSDRYRSDELRRQSIPRTAPSIASPGSFFHLRKASLYCEGRAPSPCERRWGSTVCRHHNERRAVSLDRLH
jgi:hypothetical protein